MKARLFFLLPLFCILCVNTYGQSDEINISAAFASSIELRITSDPSISWTFSTINDYTYGKNALASYQVASSVNFYVYLSLTPFTNASGDEINIKNLSYARGIDLANASDIGTRINFPPAHRAWTTSNYIGLMACDGINYSTTSPELIIEPGPNGNAGDFDDNTFWLVLQFGNKRRNEEFGLPILLDQNIAPGTYTTTLRLEATAAPL